MTVKTFAYTGGDQYFTVPLGVTSITFTLTAGQGGNQPGGGGTPGKGGKLVFTHAVTPGTQLLVVVGGKGYQGAVVDTTYGSSTYEGGGVGGGGYQQSNAVYSGDYGSGGGGLTAIAVVSPNATLAVCGGGGAAGYGGYAGGNGGGTTGGAGTVAPYNGKGGTQSAGGAAGTNASGYATSDSNNAGYGTAGASLAGGTGANPRAGGGGAGYYGGGGGGWYSDTKCCGGGGGSSWTKTTATGVTHTQGGSSTSNGAVSMSYNLPPNAPVAQAPIANAAENVANPTVFQWTNSFNEANDAQIAFDIQYRVKGTTTWTAVGKQTSAGTQYSAAANTFISGDFYEWQVRAYGQLSGTAGPWSASAFFEAQPAPVAPTIVHPAAGEVVTATNYIVTWQPVTGQQTFHLQILGDDGVGNIDPTNVIFDTGVVGGDNGSANVWPVVFETGDYQFHVVLTVQVLGVASPSSNVVAVTSIDPPVVPAIAANSSNAGGSISLTIVNVHDPAYPDAASNNVYRTGMDGIEIRIATNVPVNSTYTDYTPASRVVYTYRVSAVAPSGAESA